MKRISYFDLLSKVSPDQSDQSAMMVAESNRLFAESPHKLHQDLAPPVQLSSMAFTHNR